MQRRTPSKREQTRPVAGGFLAHLRINLNVDLGLRHRQRVLSLGYETDLVGKDKALFRFVLKGVGAVTFGKGGGGGAEQQ